MQTSGLLLLLSAVVCLLVFMEVLFTKTPPRALAESTRRGQRQKTSKNFVVFSLVDCFYRSNATFARNSCNSNTNAEINVQIVIAAIYKRMREGERQFITL